MISFAAKVQFSNFKSCFVAVPRFATKHCAKSENGATVLLRIASDICDVTLSWNGNVSSNNDEIEINSTFANRLGLKDGQEVAVQIITEFVADCEECILRPLTESDWDVISSNSEQIETNFMNQIQIITKGMCFPLWVSDASRAVFVEIASIKPERQYLKLGVNTQLIVDPQISSSTKSATVCDYKRESSLSSNLGVTSVLKKFTSMFTSEEKHSPEEESSDITTVNVFNYEHVDTIPQFSRLLPLRVLPFENEISSGPHLCNTLFVNVEEFEFGTEKYGIAKLVRILSPSELSEQSKKEPKTNVEADANVDFKEEHFTSTYVLIRGCLNCPKGCSLISKTLRKQMGLSLNSRVFLEKPNLEDVKVDNIPIKKQKVAILNSLVLTPIGMTNLKIDDVKRFLRNYLVVHKYLVVSNATLISVYNCDALVTNETNEEMCFILNSVDNISHIDIKSPMLRRINTSFGAELPLSKIECDSLLPKTSSIGGMENIFAQISTFLNFSLSIGTLKTKIDGIPEKQSALLLCGPKGSGKTTLLNCVCKKFSDSPHYVTICKIECKSLRGKRVDTLEKQWIKEITESVYRQPSIIIFEDLDCVAKSASKPDESEMEALYTRRVALLFIAVIKLLERVRKVFGNQLAVIVTCKSKESLHPLLVQSRGRHVFHELIRLLPLTVRERENMLNSIINIKLPNSDLDSLDLKLISQKCEAYLPVDLDILVDRAIHNCAMRNNSTNILILANEDFDAAFTDFVPMSLRSACIQLKSNKTLKDIGGLHYVKKTLLETILWPLKYPKLFAKCPLRPQTCVLLFGAPGTGKTLLAEAVANECGVNFISVKGPELLSKYIGASEKAVRDLFIRANTAKPCLLFFDEFDAIAARRGHDSTGVTDRVVNQILTQMDGVEALERGVYILAATSRPDLLDPALLRPGRFDKCLYCPIPDTTEREHILTVLSSKLTFKNVDLKVIAEKTNDFTGADLQALLYTSQLQALQELLKKEPQLESENKSQQIKKSDVTADTKQPFYRMPSIEDQLYPLNMNQAVDSQTEVSIIKGNQANYSNLEQSSFGATLQQTGVVIGEEHLMLALKTTKPSVNDVERSRYLRL
ncbi:peroxisome biogenesis factor 1-like protein [Leptotrombidium deliense]|uniref:Peroxisomal ATPase PEX1 n=1 Tax=Leptotrombidium deliense TaxID=299467 RepID=A0A443SRW7_9ACAR|nr:peroxisome biogenesis factor 1-like protein [Leptotrombidium deliense]